MTATPAHPSSSDAVLRPDRKVAPMRNSILVTGGTGTLGAAVVSRFVAAEHNVRVLSRKRDSTDGGRCEWAQGDLRTGAGLIEAVTDVQVIIHCATSNGSPDVVATRNLIHAARGDSHPHLVYVSIVGSDQIPLSYYRAKQECERLVENSGLPWTTLRATQFHNLIATIFATQRWLPVTLVPAGISFQPIDVRDVADHLARIADGPAAGRAPDIGGPEIRTIDDLARTYREATGRRRAVLPVPLPGEVFRGYRQGRHLTPENAIGRTTFDEFLAESPTAPGR